MHFLNRIAVPWGLLTGMLSGVLQHYKPRDVAVLEILVVATVPLIIPIFTRTVLRTHCDLLGNSPYSLRFDREANPFSIMPTRPGNFLGLASRMMAGNCFGLAIVCFLNWPYNLFYSLVYGATAISISFTVSGRTILTSATPTIEPTEPTDATERRSRAF